MKALEALRGLLGAASRPGGGGSEMLVQRFGAVLDDEQKVAGKRTYLTAVVAVVI
jgi:hypothetical protein